MRKITTQHWRIVLITLCLCGAVYYFILPAATYYKRENIDPYGLKISNEPFYGENTFFPYDEYLVVFKDNKSLYCDPDKEEQDVSSKTLQVGSKMCKKAAKIQEEKYKKDKWEKVCDDESEPEVVLFVSCGVNNKDIYKFICDCRLYH